MPRGIYKSKIGTVVSDKMDKTVVVNVIQIKKHPRYTKAIKRNTTFKAHDENEGCQVGDKVLIIETKPSSKTKRWRVSKILTRSKLAEAEVAEAESGLVEEEAEIASLGAETKEAEAENIEGVGETTETLPESTDPSADTPETEEANTAAETQEPKDKGGQGE
jgi:small subunit ribosomal protein S17